MISNPRSSCPINRALEMLGDQWSLLILRDIAMRDRRSFRELLVGSEEGISAPVLSRRLADLTTAGFLDKTQVGRGRQGRYSLTERGLDTMPLLVELGRLGAAVDPNTEARVPHFEEEGPGNFEGRMAELRAEHL